MGRVRPCWMHIAGEPRGGGQGGQEEDGADMLGIHRARVSAS